MFHITLEIFKGKEINRVRYGQGPEPDSGLVSSGRLRYRDGVFQQVGTTVSMSCSYNSTMFLRRLAAMIDAV